MEFIVKHAITAAAVIVALTSSGYAQTSSPASASPTPAKIAIINIQNALISTKDGQKAAKELQDRFAPKKAELEKKQNEISQLQDQLRKGSNTMSEDARQRVMRDVDQKTKALNRDTEDAQAELEQEQGKVTQELGQRLMAVISKYASDRGYTVVLDVSSPQTPVLYAANNIDITGDIIALYDQNAPSVSGAGAGGVIPSPGGAQPGRPVTGAQSPRLPGSPANRPAVPSPIRKPVGPNK